MLAAVPGLDHLLFSSCVESVLAASEACCNAAVVVVVQPIANITVDACCSARVMMRGGQERGSRAGEQRRGVGALSLSLCPPVFSRSGSV